MPSTSLPRSLVGRLIIPVLLTACGGDGVPTGPQGTTLASLAGTWNATEFRFEPVSGAAIEFELIGLGGSATLTIQSDGRFTLRTTSPEGQSETEGGSLGFDPEVEDFLLVQFDGESEPVEFFFQLNGNTMRLSDTVGQGEFDFDGDGVDDPARVTLTLVRA